MTQEAQQDTQVRRGFSFRENPQTTAVTQLAQLVG